MSTPLDIDAVVLINEALSGNRCSEEGRQRVGGCLSSYSYYGTVPEQITSIVVSLLKGHFFQDGNKRTAQAVYLDLCQNNGIQIISDQDRLGDVFIDIAATQRDITENARLLFRIEKRNSFSSSAYARYLFNSCSIFARFLFNFYSIPKNRYFI